MRSMYLLASRIPILSESVCQAMSGHTMKEAISRDAFRLSRPRIERAACCSRHWVLRNPDVVQVGNLYASLMPACMLAQCRMVSLGVVAS